MKTFVFNMGYDYSHITTVLAKEGVEDKTVIYLLMPSEVDSRQENSVRQLRTHLDSFTSDIELNKVEMYSGFQKNLLAVDDLLDDLEDPIVSFSGGPRDHLVPMVLAASMKDSQIEEAYIRSDLDNAVNTLDIPNLGIKLEEDEKELINLVESGEMNIDQIASKLDVSQSTASREVNSLSNKGLLKIKIEDKGKIVEPSLKALISR